MKRPILLLGLLLALSQNGPALGADRVLSLKEAVQTALKDNPEIRAFEDSVGAVREDIGIARSNLLPKVTLEERFMRTTNPTYAFSSKLNQERFSQTDFAIDSLNNPSAINDFQTSISVEQPLYVRKANVGMEMAQTEYSAKLKDFSRKKEEVAYNTVKTYLMADTAKEFIKVAEKGVEDAQEHLRLAWLRYDSGLGLYSDVLRASTNLVGAQQRLVSARKNHNIAKRALSLITGLSEPVSTDGGDREFALKDLAYYDNEARSRNDIKSLETRYGNARNGVALARSGYFPMLGIGGSYQLNDHRGPFSNEGDSWQVSAFLRWNIFDGTLSSHETSKARRREAEAAEYLNGLKKAVSFKVYEAYLGVEEAQKNAEYASAGLKTAEEGERLVRVRYENSLSPIVDLLDAQTALYNARANAVMTQNDYRTAVVNLYYESGTILKEPGFE